MAELKMIKMSNVERRKIEYLWEPFIPLGSISLIQGNGGAGKSWLALAIAAAVTNGERLPDSEAVLPPSNVIIQNAENDLGAVISHRLDILKADCDKIYHIDPTEAPLSLTDDRIEEAIKQTKARLIVLDPLQGHLNRNLNMNRAESMRPAFMRLARIAERNNCAILLVGHLTKSGNNPGYRGLGSVDIVNAVPSMMYVGVTDRANGIRAIVHSKSNYSELGVSQEFSLTKAGGFQWLGACDATIEDVTDGKGNGIDNLSKIEIAKAFIEDHYADQPMTSEALFALAEEEGISRATYRRAREELGLTKKRSDEK